MEHNVQTISGHCIEVLSKVVDSDLQLLARMSINSAVDLANRNPWAAQSLATNVLRAVARRVTNVGDITSESWRTLIPAESVRLQALRKLCVLTPVAVAFKPVQTEPPALERFNVNATIYDVSIEQYRTFNALLAVMLVSSMLRETQESRWLP